jgi:hypothetical protein
MIAITGNEFFAKRIANELKQNQIKANFVSLPKNINNLKSTFNSYSIIHFVGSPTVSRDLAKLFFLKLYGKKILVNWIGYDVRRIKNSRLRKIMVLIGNHFTDINIANAENLVDDLKKNGIQAQFQLIPVHSIYPIQDLPKEKRVAVYLPDNYPHFAEFYQESIIKKLVNDFPEIEFLILKNSGKTFSEPNVKCFAWCEDMEKIYKQVKVVIRLPIEDGTSGIIIETLSMGRYMIASNTFLPYCEVIHNYEEAKNALKRTIEKTTVNEKGSTHIKKNFSSIKLVNDLIKIYDKLSNTCP